MKYNYSLLLSFLLLLVYSFSCSSNVSNDIEDDAIKRWSSLDFGIVKMDQVNDKFAWSIDKENTGYFYNDYIWLGDTTVLPVTIGANTDHIYQDSTLRDAVVRFKNVQRINGGLQFSFVSEKDLLRVYSVLNRTFGSPQTVKDSIKGDELPNYALWITDNYTIDFNVDKPRKRGGSLYYGARSLDELGNGYKNPYIHFKMKRYSEHIDRLEDKLGKNLSIDEIISVGFSKMFFKQLVDRKEECIRADFVLDGVNRIDGRLGGDKYIGSLAKEVTEVNFDLVIRDKTNGEECYRSKNEVIKLAEPIKAGESYAPHGESSISYTIKFKDNANPNGFYILKAAHGQLSNFIAVAELNSLKYADGTIDYELQQ